MNVDEKMALCTEAYDAGAKAMKEAIEAKLKDWHDWISREPAQTKSQELTRCAYAGARMVVHLTNLPQPTN